MSEDYYPDPTMIAPAPTYGKLAAALAKAQGQIEGAKKDTTNAFYRSKYADLAAVWEACRKPLSDNELAVVQLPSTVIEGTFNVPQTRERAGYTTTGANVSVRTRLMHSSGEWVETTISTRTAAESQPIGSAITYLRRYGLAAVVGIAPEDDDGEAAQGRPNGNGTQQAPSPRSEISRGAEAGLAHLAQNARPSTPAEVALQHQAAQDLATQVATRPSNQDRLKAKARELNLSLKAITDVLAKKEWPNPARLTEDQVLDMERTLLPEYARRTLSPAAPPPEILPDGSRNPEFLIDPEEEEEVA